MNGKKIIDWPGTWSFYCFIFNCIFNLLKYSTSFKDFISKAKNNLMHYNN